jgi:alkanesulfonate monooxygenase SsuD/methylene tetrahydromethanopterin reductase-like flavin-dependent oxidoreductase (luciferase family)
MKVSINVTNYSWPGGVRELPAALAATAAEAEAAGLDTVWVSDHLLQNDPGAGPGERDMLEAYTTLGFLAASTSEIRIGTMVTAVTYREPALLLKAVATVDALSGGRAWLGIGAGYPGEAEALDLPLPPTSERFDEVERVLQLAGQVWEGNDAGRPGEGSWPLDRWAPQPVHGRIPVLIGGAGEKRTLPLVARYADACNLFDIRDGGRTLRHKLEVLDRQCQAVGRDPATVERTVSTRLERGQDAVSFADHLATLHGYGLDHAVVIAPGPWHPESLEVLARAAERVRQL